MQEQENKKIESKMRKKYDEEREDERIHKQLRELQDQFMREENNVKAPQVRHSYGQNKEASLLQDEAGSKQEQQRQLSNERPIINTGVHQSQQQYASPPKKMISPPPPIVRLSNQNGQPMAIVSRNSLTHNGSQDSLGLLNDRTPPPRRQQQESALSNNYHTNSQHQLPPPLTFTNQKPVALT